MELLEMVGHRTTHHPGLGDEIHRAGGQVDDGGAGDADFRLEVGTALNVSYWNRCAQAHLPQRVRSRRIIRIEGVDTIVFGLDVYDVVEVVGNHQTVDVKRLRVNLAVQCA